MHQFLSFTRGFWLGLMAGTMFSVALYLWAGRGGDLGPRTRRSALMLGMLTGLSIIGGTVVAAAYGISGLGEIAADRLASSAGTENNLTNGSNIVRLMEYAIAFKHILQSPWIGHGLGFFYVKVEPISGHLVQQWFVHQNYILVWLKQGLIGLALFVNVLIATIRTGVKGARLEESWQAAWCGGAAAVGVYLFIYAGVHFPLAEVNATFTAAMIWGTAMSLVSTGKWSLAWRNAPGVPAAAAGAQGPRGMESRP
jgi:O-antigen ligase